MIRAFNKKVKPRHFSEGDLVLKKILPNVKDPRGKFTPNYDGLYVVRKVLSEGALILGEMDGPNLRDPVNLDMVKF